MRNQSSARPAVHSHTPIRVVLGTLLLVAVLPFGATAAPLCIAPNSGGTAEVPALGCPFLSEPDPFKIEDGLPPASTIEIEVEILPLTLVSSGPGGSLGGDFNISEFDIVLTMSGTGALLGFFRTLNMSGDFETHYAPRTPGNAVQSFASDIFFLDTAPLFGDPDFDTLTLRAGTGYGLPSPGSTTLTRLGGIGTDFEVDSFFDVTYEIDFIGAPGSFIAGLSGTTVDVARIQQGVPEPSTALLLASGLLGLAVRGSRRTQ